MKSSRYICGTDEISHGGSSICVIVKDMRTNKYIKHFDSVKKFNRWLWWKKLFGMKVVIIQERNETNY